MLWHNFYLLQEVANASRPHIPDWLQYVLIIAPLLSFLAALSNLLLARYIFKFTKQKNDLDRNIKWFQELIYTPHKETLFSYFKALLELKEKIPYSSDIPEEVKISLMGFVKQQRNFIMDSFIDLLKDIAPTVHINLKGLVDNLTDELTIVFDNDELKWTNDKTYDKEIGTRVRTCRAKFISSFFNYKG